MAIYAVGDVQGCVHPPEMLLEKLRFDPAQDQIWFAGDLVNRGPDSLATLRLIRELGSSAIAVLGNHDLHLLAVAEGIKRCRPNDTLNSILEASDRDELLHWLRHLPLVHIDRKIKTLMVHAGVYPGWNIAALTQYASEIEEILRGTNYLEFLKNMYGKEPTKWHKQLGGWQRARFITNSLTRMRYCGSDRTLDFAQKGSPFGKTANKKEKPSALVPWFRHSKMKCSHWHIIFGHWSTLGFHREGNVTSLDSGCVWGGALTAVQLDGENTGQYWQVHC